MPSNVLGIISKAVSGNGKLLKTTQNRTFGNCGWNTWWVFQQEPNEQKYFICSQTLHCQNSSEKCFWKLAFPHWIQTIKILLYFSTHILWTLDDQADTTKIEWNFTDVTKYNFHPKLMRFNWIVNTQELTLPDLFRKYYILTNHI